MAVGTSVGTIVALVPIAAGIASQTAAEPALLVGIIVGGAFFGDNLSFISDTTIAATKTQGCAMADKFKANLWIALPAALAVTVLYLFLGRDGGAPVAAEAVKPLLILPYLLVIVLAVCGMDVLAVLVTGTVANALIGILGGSVGWIGFLKACGDGIASMGELIIVTMLAGGLLELIRQDGGLEWMIRGLTRRITGKRGAELSIAALVSLVNVCTANNTIAIITSGALAKEITERFGLDPRKTASILDTFSCLVQGILPYGAQMLMASGLAGIAATAIIPHLYYPFALGAVALLAILLRLPRKYS
jgi:Na+/H+ antiporter NhaC